ncbi:MAG: hypothetical protein LBE12_16200 [Planctomycetaceae bacterium]|jgi:hypothetical protein|nr:hypothetical protein [Planctomycetaceae bacterium]
MFGYLPLDVTIGCLNSYLRGWSGYFSRGHPSKPFAALDNYVQKRLIQFLKHQSQRPFKPPEGMSWYALIYKKLGVIRLAARENLR